MWSALPGSSRVPTTNSSKRSVNPKYPSIPTLNPDKKIVEVPFISIKKDGKRQITTNFEDGTSEFYLMDSDIIIAKYKKDKYVISYKDGKTETTIPGELKKIEYPPKERKGKLQKNIIYQTTNNENEKEARFIVTDFLDGNLSINDKNKKKLTHFYEDGNVLVYKTGKQIKKYRLGGDIHRGALPDGTQFKEFEKKRLIITKDLGAQTKTAKYTTPEGESISLLSKNFDTGEVNLLFKTSDLTKSKIFKKTKFSEQAKAARDSYLGLVKRDSTAQGGELKELVKEGFIINKDKATNTKIAGVMKGEKFIPFLKKSNTNELEILVNLSKFHLSEDLKSLKEIKFSKIAKDILEALKKLKVL